MKQYSIWCVMSPSVPLLFNLTSELFSLPHSYLFYGGLPVGYVFAGFLTFCTKTVINCQIERISFVYSLFNFFAA